MSKMEVNIMKNFNTMLIGASLMLLTHNSHANENACIAFDALKPRITDSAVMFKNGNWLIKPDKGTDLYTSPDASFSANNIPMVTTEAKSDFEMQAHVNASFNDAYDGAGIVIYIDQNNWAKLMFERFESGSNGIASTINRNSGDDAYHLRTSLESLYLKAINKKEVIKFYYSLNGDKWLYLRAFTLNTNTVSDETPIRVGLFAQSPLKGDMLAEFKYTCLTTTPNT